MFSKLEVQSLLNIISKNSLFFIASQLGKHLLLPDDKLFLEKQGIDLSKIKTIHTPIEQAYLFGHVSTLLENNIVKQMTFKDFKKYLISDKWLPLIEKERLTLTAVENFAYNEIKGLGNRYIQKLGNTVVEVDEKLELSRKAIIKEKSKEAIFKRENKQWLSSELRRTTEDWERDWSRTADYIMTSAYSKGSTEAAKKKDGRKAKVWMSVYPQACKHCIAAYLTNGIGSRPRVFLVSDLEGNGTNIGRKMNDSKAVIPPYHPNCFINAATPVMTENGYLSIRKIKIGDFVLTHKGRFRKVTQLHFNTIQKKEIDNKYYNITYKISQFDKKDRLIIISKITLDHPFLSNEKWVSAKKLREGDTLSLLHRNCFNPECNNLTSISTNFEDNKFCSITCGNSYSALKQWNNYTEKERNLVSMHTKEGNYNRYKKTTKEYRQELTKNGREVHKKVMSEWSKEEWVERNLKIKNTNKQTWQGFTKAEKTKKVSKARKSNSLHGRSGSSPLEIIFSKILKKFNDDFKNNFKIKTKRIKPKNYNQSIYRWLDFYNSKLNIVFEIDSEYWHSDQEIDLIRDKEVSDLIDADIFHIKEEEFSNLIKLEEKVGRLVSNHSGDYSFQNVEIVKIEEVFYKGSGAERTTTYNISVEEDESYVVKGIAVHNCRCDPNYFADGSEWDEKTKTFKKPKYKSKYKPMIKVTINGKEYEG